MIGPVSRWLTITMAAVLLGGLGVRGQQPTAARTPIDVSRLGPRIGQRVPDFALADQTGATRTLQSIMGPKGAMLVFVRSADW